MKTAGTFDDKMILLEPSSNLTATATGSAVDFNGDDMDELNIRVIVPSVSGTSPVLSIAYQRSDDKSNWTTVYTFPNINAKGEYNKKIRGKGRWGRVVATVSGTSPNFGKVIIGVSTGGVL